MCKVNTGIGLLGVVLVGLASAGTAWAQSDELPRRLQESITRSLVNDGFPSAAAAFDTEVTLTANDGDEEDSRFGISVSISGDTAIVGAFYDDDNGFRSGSAYIFARNADGAGNWNQIKKLFAPDGESDDRFGSSVSVSGDTVIVGAYRDDDDGFDSGSAYVFGRDMGGTNNWGEVKKLTASDGSVGHWFGFSVSIDGDRAVVGAIFDSAYIFNRNAGGANNWGQVRKLLPSDGDSDNLFGVSVSISADTAIVGAMGDNDNGSFSGSAYMFGRNTGGADNWGQIKKLLASDGAADDFFGASVSISGDTAVVGANIDANIFSSGSAYVFGRDTGGTNNWGEVKKLLAGDENAFLFGVSVCISGDTAVVGAQWDDDNGAQSGSAYVFRRDSGGTDSWGQVKKLLASDGVALDEFGRSVSISGDTAIVGAAWDDDPVGNPGAAYVFFDGAIQSVPTVSEWGLIVMTLLGCTVGTVLCGRRRRAVL